MTKKVSFYTVFVLRLFQDQLTRQSQEHLELEKSQNAGGFRSESSQPGHTGTIADRFKDSPSVEPAAMRSSFTLGVSAQVIL